MTFSNFGTEFSKNSKESIFFFLSTTVKEYVDKYKHKSYVERCKLNTFFNYPTCTNEHLVNLHQIATYQAQCFNFSPEDIVQLLLSYKKSQPWHSSFDSAFVAHYYVRSFVWPDYTYNPKFITVKQKQCKFVKNKSVIKNKHYNKEKKDWREFKKFSKDKAKTGFNQSNKFYKKIKNREFRNYNKSLIKNERFDDCLDSIKMLSNYDWDWYN